MSIWTKTFWKAATERAVRATAWAAGSALLNAGTGLVDTDWKGTLSLAGMAGLLSLLAGIGIGAATGTGPSLSDAETLADTTTVSVTAPADVQVDVTPTETTEED